MFQIVKAALGENNAVQINRDALAKEYNGFAVDSCLVAIEEIKISDGRYSQMDRLKELITSPKITVRRMYADGNSQVNIANYLMFSNHTDALAVTADDRRFMVCRAKHESKEEYLADGMTPEYFEQLYAVIKRNPEIIHSGLALRDISQFKPNTRAPHTEALVQMGAEALSADAQMLLEAIEDLTECPSFNADIIPVVQLPPDVTDRLKTKTLKRAFSHLGYVPWTGEKTPRIEVLDYAKDKRKSRLYVKAKFANITGTEAREMLKTK